MKEVFIVLAIFEDYEEIIDIFSTKESAVNRLLDYGMNLEDDSEGDYYFRPVYDEDAEGYWVKATNCFVEDILLVVERRTVKD